MTILSSRWLLVLPLPPADQIFIDDIVIGTRFAMERNYPCEIFNLGNHKSENIMNMIGILEDCIGKKATIDFQPMQLGDVYESFADIDKSMMMLKYKPTTNIADGVPIFFEWYKEYHKIK